MSVPDPKAVPRASKPTNPPKPKKAVRLPKSSSAKLPRSTTHIDQLKAELSLFVRPDYTLGDYWPKVDIRLQGRIHDLIARTLDVLDARYPAKPIGTGKHDMCSRNDD